MQSGTELGRYTILSKIGAGGMGEVYLAKDKQLDRNVALKLLLPEFCCDLERVQRFKLEAKAASALNHPNIITIHEIDELDDKLFITTEYIEGKTVREKIEKGDLTLLDTIRFAEQIADALAVAHLAHIVHRDIKPENIMIREDGYAKILDFGLAKPAPHQTSGTNDATIQMVKTQPGLVMGSVRYMSPEQARGKPTDERTDIWSLGVVLYEMLTGKNPFEGETISDSLAALIHIEVPPLEDVPEELNRIISKSLRKNTEERYQNIKDLSLDLKDLRAKLELGSIEFNSSAFNRSMSLPQQDTSENKTLIHQTLSAESNTDEQKRNNWIPTRHNTMENGLGFGIIPIFALLFAGVLAVGGWFYLPSIFSSNVPVFQSIQVSRKTDNGKAQEATVSPDGKLVAYVDMQGDQPTLVVRQLATESIVPIVPANDKGFMQPTFSRDGEYIYYVQVQNGVGTLFQIPKLGGKSKEIMVDIDSSVTFSPNGKQFAFIRHNPTEGGDTILVADSDGQNLKPSVKSKAVGFNSFTDVEWSESGQELLLAGYKGGNESIDKISVMIANLDGNKEVEQPDFIEAFNKEGWEKANGFIWLKNEEGLVFIGRKNTDDATQVWHLSFENGESRQVTTDTSDYASLSASDDGNTIVATKVDRISNLMSYIPSTNEIRQLNGESKNFLGYSGISQMPDGKILFSKLSGKEVNIYSMDENGGNEKQLTSGIGFNYHPAATPDGKYILFSSNRDKSSGIWRMDADGENPFRLTKVENGRDGYAQVSKDGETVFFTRKPSDGGRSKLMKTSINGGEVSPLLPDSKSSDMFTKISPDGKNLAIHSFVFNEKAASLEAAVKIFDLEAGKLKNDAKELEFDLHKDFQWSPDGKSLTYVNRKGNDNLWNIAIADRKEKQITKFNSGNIQNFLWSNDGKKIFIVRGIMNSDMVLIQDIEDKKS